MMRKSLIHQLSILILWALASCNGQEAMLSDTAGRDSSALYVAVMPVEDCLPLYLAEKRGLADTLGLKMKLLRYDALMDIDTAYVLRHADVAWEDSFRLAQYHTQTPHFATDSILKEPDTLWMPTKGRWCFVASRKSKIKKLKDLHEKMVGITRWSLADTLCNIVVNQAGINQQDVYRPQINNVKLRMRMLRENLLDAAILPEPYASWAKAEKHRILFEYPKDVVPSDSVMRKSRITGFYVRRNFADDTLRLKQLKLLEKVYRKARKMLETEGLSAIDSLDVFTL